MPTVVNPYVDPIDINNVAPAKHASQHRVTGADPLTPADLGIGTVANVPVSLGGTGAATLAGAVASLQLIPPYASVVRSAQDANGVFTVYTWELPAAYVEIGCPAKWVSELSGGTSPQYTTRYFRVYGSDKAVLLRTFVYSLVYDAAGNVVSETLTGVQ